MRLLTVISQEEEEQVNPYAFSYFLSTEGIENQCEEVRGSDDGPTVYRIWIVDEDQVGKAEELFSKYLKNPESEQFKGDYEAALRAEELEQMKEERERPAPSAPQRRVRFLSPVPYGKLSIAIIIAVIILFFWAQMKREPQPPAIPGIPKMPYLPKVERVLMYDFPKFLQLRDELLTIYTPEEVEAGQPPNEEAAKLITEIRQTPFWNGLYDRIVNYIRYDIPFAYHGPLFEKISQGQIWRLITPIFLHFDLLHIFFNLLWFILLGNQIEYRLGFWRYLLLIVIAGVISDTSQYLMSGPFFMGLSGVIAAFAGFIFARQQVAPWEGYLLHRITLIFLAIFIFGVFALQVIFFFLQIFGKFNQTIPIANTAHITGAIVGYLLGRSRLFALHPRLKKT